MSDVLEEEQRVERDQQQARDKTSDKKSKKTIPGKSRQVVEPKIDKKESGDDVSDGSLSDAEIEGDGCTVLEVGDHVMVGKNRGRIAFIGEVDYAEGIMIGVEMESLVGKNDGTVKGRRYFACKMGHGLMVRASELQLL